MFIALCVLGVAMVVEAERAMKPTMICIYVHWNAWKDNSESKNRLAR
jgi:hypothetical protein